MERRKNNFHPYHYYIDLPRFILFCVRLCRQQPINTIFNRTNVVPEATPTSNNSPGVVPIGVEVVVGGPPSDEAGCDGGGASICGLCKIV